MQKGSHEPDQPSVVLAPSDAPEQRADGTSPQPYIFERSTFGRNIFGRWLLVGIALIAIIALVWIGPQLWQLVQDQEALADWVAQLGWLGPVALVAINAIQIVIAPIPGYVAQAAAGFLFGPFWGGVWSSLGLLLGASAAFWLARLYGRPLVGRLVGEERLARWEHVSYSDSTLLWVVLLLGPIGDIPYFLAGLAQVSYLKILAITLIIRVPSTFVVAAAGAGVMLLNWWQIALLVVVLLGLFFVFIRHQEQIIRWCDERIGNFISFKR
jgi:uncharacterized membrane protein YdjX (TVP38/TMEM64 family)